jgi:hypothetical protein
MARSTHRDGALDPEALRAANINPVTHLATDYLNHFNEVVMLMELVPDMPDMVDDVRAWQPKSYARHFAESGFAGKALAIAAYDAAPPEIRGRFDALVRDMDAVVLGAVAGFERDLPETWPRLAETAIHKLHALIEATSAVVNGTDRDEAFAAGAEPHTQADIDALFAKP